MNHVHLQWKIHFINPMFARGMEMELLQVKLPLAFYRCSSIDNHFNGSTEVFEFCRIDVGDGDIWG